MNTSFDFFICGLWWSHLDCFICSCDDHILTVVFVTCDIHILTALFVVCDDHIFKDDVLFYRFRIDDGTYEKDVDTKMFYKGQQIYKL